MTRSGSDAIGLSYVPCSLERFAASAGLAQANHPLHRLPQLRRIEPYSSTKYDLRISNVRRRPYRVAGDDDEVRLHTGLNRANPFVEAEDLGAVRRHDLNRLLRRKPRLDQQLVVALVAVPRDGAEAARIRSGAEQSARLHERALEFHRLLEGRALDAVFRRLPAVVESRHRLGRRRIQRVEHALVPGDSARRRELEHVQRRRHRDVPRDHLLERALDVGAVDVEGAVHRSVARPRTDVGLLAAVILGVCEQPVLELVDTESDGLAETDRAEVRGHLHAVLVRFVDCGRELPLYINTDPN